jgi:hypothetical protein
MATSTIAVKSETLDLLKHAKDDMGVETYDELLRKLVISAKIPKKSLRGILKTTKPFVREKIDRFS